MIAAGDSDTLEQFIISAMDSHLAKVLQLHSHLAPWQKEIKNKKKPHQKRKRYIILQTKKGV